MKSWWFSKPYWSNPDYVTIAGQRLSAITPVIEINKLDIDRHCFVELCLSRLSRGLYGGLCSLHRCYSPVNATIAVIHLNVHWKKNARCFILAVINNRAANVARPSSFFSGRRPTDIEDVSLFYHPQP